MTPITSDSEIGLIIGLNRSISRDCTCVQYIGFSVGREDCMFPCVPQVPSVKRPTSYWTTNYLCAQHPMYFNGWRDDQMFKTWPKKTWHSSVLSFLWYRSDKGCLYSLAEPQDRSPGAALFLMTASPLTMEMDIILLLVGAHKLIWTPTSGEISCINIFHHFTIYNGKIPSVIQLI